MIKELMNKVMPEYNSLKHVFVGLIVYAVLTALNNIMLTHSTWWQVESLNQNVPLLIAFLCVIAGLLGEMYDYYHLKKGYTQQFKDVVFTGLAGILMFLTTLL